MTNLTTVSPAHTRVPPARIAPPRQLAVVFAVAFSAALATPSAMAARDVTVAVQSTFTTMDPYDANDNLSLAVAKSFYQGLYGFDKDMKLVPVLAEGHSVSDDGLVYTVKLKSGIEFHDGTPFDAKAVKATFDRVTDPNSKLKRYNLYKNIAKTEVVDDTTVKFTMTEPFSPFINTLAHPSGVIISPAAIARYGRELAQHPVGTGPFKFVEWKPTEYMKVEKFEKYWRKGYPKVDSIIWRPVVDNNARAAVLQTGEAQFSAFLPPESAATLQGKPNVEVVSAPSILHRYLSMNTLQKPFDNPKVRQALNYAINKEALVKVAFAGYAVPAEGVVPHGVEFAEKLGPWPYDPAKARSLLKEAGYPNGFETTLWSAYNYTTAQKVIQFAQQQLAQVGVKVHVQALEAGQRVERVESAQDPATAPVRMYYVGWSASTGEPDWALRPLFASESFPPKLFNTAYYKNDKVDADIHGALKTTDAAKRAEFYKDAQKQIWADAPWVFLVTEKLLSAQSKKLSGFHMMPDSNFNFDEIELKD